MGYQKWLARRKGIETNGRTMRRDPRSPALGTDLDECCLRWFCWLGLAVYKHIWQAAIPHLVHQAYLASLRWLLAKYRGWRGLLLAWWAGFSLARSLEIKVEEGTGQRQLGS